MAPISAADFDEKVLSRMSVGCDSLMMFSSPHQAYPVVGNGRA